jgi:hypothetical protein
MSETYTMPPQFLVVADALVQPVDRIRTALSVVHQLTGRPLDMENFEADWGAPMKRNIKKVSADINRLGREVMAADCEPSFAYSKEVVADLDRALAQYIRETDEFLSRPWPKGLEPGRLLTAAIMEKPLRDILDLLEQVRCVILDIEKAVLKYGGTRMDLTMSINIDQETEAFRVWAENTEQLATFQTQFQFDNSYRNERTGRSFSNVLAGLALGWWLGGD